MAAGQSLSLCARVLLCMQMYVRRRVYEQNIPHSRCLAAAILIDSDCSTCLHLYRLLPLFIGLLCIPGMISVFLISRLHYRVRRVVRRRLRLVSFLLSHLFSRTPSLLATDYAITRVSSDDVARKEIVRRAKRLSSISTSLMRHVRVSDNTSFPLRLVGNYHR